MDALLARFRTKISYEYKNISQSSLESKAEGDEDDGIHTAPRGLPHGVNVTSISRRHAACLYTLSLALAVSMMLMLITDTTTTVRAGGLGSYEEAFNTEIKPDRNTLSLRKVKFYGGIVYDDNGTAFLTPPPPGTPDYFGLPGRETDHYWNMDLKDRFLKLNPKDWPPGAGELSEKDLVNGTIRMEPNVLHTLHCLVSTEQEQIHCLPPTDVDFKNYIRKALSPEHYGFELPSERNSTEPQPLPFHTRQYSSSSSGDAIFQRQTEPNVEQGTV